MLRLVGGGRYRGCRRALCRGGLAAAGLAAVGSSCVLGGIIGGILTNVLGKADDISQCGQ
jgi:hypothetical protein